MTYTKVELDVIRWSEARKIIPNSTPFAQAMKAVEEINELVDALREDKREDAIDAVGDTVVCLINVCALMDENFGSVLVVAGRKRPSYIVLSDQPEAESVSGSLVLGGIGLKIGPEFVGEDVFWIDLCFGSRRKYSVGDFRTVLGMEDARKPWVLLGKAQVVERESRVLAETGDEDALPMLWDEMPGVDDFGLDLVAQVLAQGLHDDPESVPLVMRNEVLDVLEEEGLGFLLVDDPGDVEEQCPLGFAFEAMRAA